MSEPAQKCKTMNAILSKTLELIFAFKMNHSCSFRLKGNLDFLEFLPNFFYNISYCKVASGARREREISVLDNNPNNLSSEIY